MESVLKSRISALTTRPSCWTSTRRSMNPSWISPVNRRTKGSSFSTRTTVSGSDEWASRLNTFRMGSACSQPRNSPISLPTWSRLIPGAFSRAIALSTSSSSIPSSIHSMPSHHACTTSPRRRPGDASSRRVSDRSTWFPPPRLAGLRRARLRPGPEEEGPRSGALGSSSVLDLLSSVGLAVLSNAPSTVRSTLSVK